jgi:hypothetical protein
LFHSCNITENLLGAVHFLLIWSHLGRELAMG